MTPGSQYCLVPLVCRYCQAPYVPVRDTDSRTFCSDKCALLYSAAAPQLSQPPDATPAQPLDVAPVQPLDVAPAQPTGGATPEQAERVLRDRSRERIETARRRCLSRPVEDYFRDGAVYDVVSRSGMSRYADFDEAVAVALSRWYGFGEMSRVDGVYDWSRRVLLEIPDPRDRGIALP